VKIMEPSGRKSSAQGISRFLARVTMGSAVGDDEVTGGDATGGVLTLFARKFHHMAAAPIKTMPMTRVRTMRKIFLAKC